MRFFLFLFYATALFYSAFLSNALADPSDFYVTDLIPTLRDLIGKPLSDATINFNNQSELILDSLTPEGARFFAGGTTKVPNQSADGLRQASVLTVLILPCRGGHDLTSKISTVAVWENVTKKARNSGSNLQQLLSMMNNPVGLVTPSSLRAPKTDEFKGPVFEYVRGDTTEDLAFLNEGETLRINWSIRNESSCPH